MRVEQSVRLLSEAIRSAIVVEQNQLLTSECELDLPQRLKNPGFLASLYTSLAEPERKVIQLFLTQSPRGFLSKKQWDRVVTQQRVQLSLGLTKLRRLGIIFTVRKLWSEVGYIMPAEIRECFTESEKASVYSGEQTLYYYIASGRGIHLDVFALLLFLQGQEVLITRKRTIHRRFLQKLAPLLSLRREHTVDVVTYQQSQGASDEYQPEVAIVLDIAMRLNLVYADDKTLHVSQAELERWLIQTESERWLDTLELAMEWYMPKDPWIEAFTIVMKQHGTEWTSVNGQLELLSRAGYLLPDQAQEVIVTRWLHLILGFGLIQLGVDEADEMFWRWTPINQQEAFGGWYVEASGEVIVPPMVSLAHLWKLSQLGQLSFTGDLIRCQLQASAIQAQIANGWSVQQIIELLAEHCVHPLQDAVKELVRHWASNTRQIKFERVIRIRTASPKLLEELQQLSALKLYMQEVFSPTDFLIDEKQETSLVALLRQYGYEPQIGVWQHSKSNDRANEASGDPENRLAGVGLLSLQQPWEGYLVENVFPDRMEGTPEIAQLPKIWTQHYQRYQQHTLRDLLKRAVELQMEVQVEHVNGGEWQGVPQNVEVTMGYWYVTLDAARRRQRLRLDDVGRVRIILPEYLT